MTAQDRDEIIGWALHGVGVDGRTDDPGIADRWRDTVRPCVASTSPATLTVRLDARTTGAAPPAPDVEPQYRQGDLLEYYVAGSTVVARFPRYGTLTLDLEHGSTHGTLVGQGWQEPGVFEDLLAVALSPHLRRRELFLVHAFGAALAGRGVLLVGGVGAGKTTTGISLLEAGWKLLSNDSPAIAAGGLLLSYPGQLSAYPDSYRRFESTATLGDRSLPRRKIAVQAETVWPDVWCAEASAGAIVFPAVGRDRAHRLHPVDPPEALRRLLPHAIEQWDRPMIPRHLEVLRELVESAPAFDLRLGSAVATLPAVLAGALGDRA
jgi:hypothetical protein